MFKRKERELPEALQGVFLGLHPARTMKALTRAVEASPDTGPITAFGNMTQEPNASAATEVFVFGVLPGGIVFVSLGQTGSGKPQRDSAQLMDYRMVTGLKYVAPEIDDDPRERLEFTILDATTWPMYPYVLPKSRAIIRNLARTLPSRLGVPSASE